MNTATALLVDCVYIYGVPSMVRGSSGSTSNQDSACTPGMRIFNEDIEVVDCTFYEFWCTPGGRRVTNVNFASQIGVKNGYHHPRMDMLVLRLVGGPT